MNVETRYTIAFIVAQFANPTADKWGITGSDSGTKYFDTNGEVSQNTINLRESGAGSVRGSGSGFAFSRIDCSGGKAESFDLRLNGRRFEGTVFNGERERFSGSIEGEEARFDSGERYQLQ